MRSWRTVLAALVGLALGAAILLHRDELASAVDSVTELSPGGILSLVLLTAVTIFVAGWSVATVHPGLSVRRSIAVHQSTVAASNTVVASGPISLALRISMLRSWQMSHALISTCIVVSNVMSSFRLWIMTLVVASIGLTGTAPELLDTWVFAGVVVIAILVMGLSATWWWLVVRHEHLASWCARRAQGMVDRMRRRWRRLPEVDLVEAVEGFRTTVAAMARDRGRHILAASVAEMVVVMMTPVVVARAFGLDASVVSTAQIVLAFGMVRLAAALSPLPGGIGVSEIGATLLLTRLGAPEGPVLATVLTHRAITFLAPLLVGGLCVAWWHRRTDRPRGLAGEPELATSVS